MAESVDALVSNTSGATRAGSTPALGTICTTMRWSQRKARCCKTITYSTFLFLHTPNTPHNTKAPNNSSMVQAMSNGDTDVTLTYSLNCSGFSIINAYYETRGHHQYRRCRCLSPIADGYIPWGHQDRPEGSGNAHRHKHSCRK